ncbi:MAG: hypothetical protein WBC21_04105 [Minisyncoccales bacterium]
MGTIEFLALTWLAIACYSYVIVIFIRKVKREEGLSFDEKHDKSFKGFSQMIFVAVVGTVFLILSILGLIPAYI